MESPITTASPGARTRRRYGARLALATSAALLLTLLFAATVEAAKSGKLLYAKRIGSTSTTEAGAWAVAAGPNGVTALAGGQEKSDALYPMVAKYTGAGKRVWLKTYTTAGTGRAVDVAFDRRGNVYVAATVDSGAGDDIVVVKYSASGAFRWATPPYDGGSNDPDDAQELAVDGKGNVVVLGESDRAGLTGIVVLKYDKNGTMAWAESTRWDSDPGDPNAGDYEVDDLALDGKGDIYVAGSNEYLGLENAIVLKVMGADGAKQKGWIYEPRHGDSSSFDELTVRGSSVASTGSVWTEGTDGSENALVAKFDLGLHEKAWREWGVGNKSEEWFGEAVLDYKGNVYVTGDQWIAGTYGKVVTMKLNGRLSKVVWKRTYMPASKDAEGWYITCDGAGSIYVAGVKNANIGRASYLTLKYSPAGVRKWVSVWSSGGGGPWSHPAGLVLGSKDGVYVGGDAWGKGGIHQAVLLKYQR